LEIANNGQLSSVINILAPTPLTVMIDYDHNDVVLVNAFGEVTEATASVLVSVVSGRISFLTLDQITLLQGSGNLDKITSMRGPMNYINAALASMQYACRSSDGCYAGVMDTITIVADDEGHSGKGGAVTDTKVIRVTVIADVSIED
jgi:hypothetical protein